MKRLIIALCLLSSSCATQHGGYDARVRLSKTSDRRSERTGEGIASFYTSGRRTANGEKFYPEGFTIAHKTLPFGTWVLFTNPTNHRRARGRVNDRGPFVKGRLFDISKGLARELGFINQGTARLQWEIVK